jgi:hypothetical protein
VELGNRLSISFKKDKIKKSFVKSTTRCHVPETVIFTLPVARTSYLTFINPTSYLLFSYFLIPPCCLKVHAGQFEAVLALIMKTE